MFDETTFQTCVRAVQDLVFLKTGTDISVELQSVFKLDETLNDLRKLVKEGNGTGRVVEMISDMVSAIVNGYVTNLAETTHLKSQTDNLEIDQLSKGLPGEMQPVIQRLKFFINRTCLAKQEVHMIMEAIDKMVSFQISVMRMIHSSLKESSFYRIYDTYIH